jgi:molybdopterin synthase sulfur carrier subunit
MIVEVKLFSLLRQQHPGPDRSAPLRVELEDGATVQDLVERLALPAGLARACFVNDRQQPFSAVLHADDRVSLFPPVAGGAPVRVFIAGIMQGSRLDDGIVDQGYRERLGAALAAHLPEVEVFDPIRIYPGSVTYSPDQARAALFDLARIAGLCDVLVAFAPEASMGTAIEMWEARRAGARVYTISPMRANWVVAHLSDRVFDTLEEFVAFVEGGGLGG